MPRLTKQQAAKKLAENVEKIRDLFNESKALSEEHDLPFDLEGTGVKLDEDSDSSWDDSWDDSGC